MTLFVNKTTKKNKLNLVLFYNEGVHHERFLGKGMVAKYTDKSYPQAMDSIMSWIQEDAPFINRIVADKDLIPTEWLEDTYYEGPNVKVRVWAKEDFKSACSLVQHGEYDGPVL